MLAWLAAGLSTAICIFRWFRDVRRIIRERKSTVESAASQLEILRKRATEQADAENAAVLKRGEDIYRQALEHYERTRKKPWVFLPAALMGFRHLKNEGTDE